MDAASLLMDAIAAVLILSPVEPTALPTDPPPGLFSAYKRQVVALDMWDLTRGGWVEFPGEIKWARGEVIRLADYPPSIDHLRWSFRDARGEIDFLRARQDCLRADALWRNPGAFAPCLLDPWREPLAECEWEINCWLPVLEITQATTTQDRRRWLKRLRDKIGDEAYYQGVVPP